MAESSLVGCPLEDLSIFNWSLWLTGVCGGLLLEPSPLCALQEGREHKNRAGEKLQEPCPWIFFTCLELSSRGPLLVHWLGTCCLLDGLFSGSIPSKASCQDPRFHKAPGGRPERCCPGARFLPRVLSKAVSI